MPFMPNTANRDESTEKLMQQFGKLMAATTQRLVERLGELERSQARVVTQTRLAQQAGDDSIQQHVIQGAGAGGGTAFSLRYRNDILRGSEEGVQRLEWIAKSSPFQPNEDDTPYVPTGDYATDYAHCWPDDQWTAVFGGDTTASTEGA
jgi:hypothetical protein